MLWPIVPISSHPSLPTAMDSGSGVRQWQLSTGHFAPYSRLPHTVCLSYCLPHFVSRPPFFPLRATTQICLAACDISPTAVSLTNHTLSRALGQHTATHRFRGFVCDVAQEDLHAALSSRFTAPGVSERPSVSPSRKSSGSAFLQASHCLAPPSGCNEPAPGFAPPVAGPSPPEFRAALCIFTLSALHPNRMLHALRQILSVLAPGGLLLFRDYGVFDMVMFRLQQQRVQQQREQQQQQQQQQEKQEQEQKQQEQEQEHQEQERKEQQTVEREGLEEPGCQQHVNGQQGMESEEQTGQGQERQRREGAQQSGHGKTLNKADQNMRCANDRLYQRGDGTLAYFFSVEEVRVLMGAAGFECKEVEYCCVRNENRRKGREMKRVWVHGVFKKGSG
ncbi:unnamed protein product [Closterium sp. Naga37s-1]|nr:unnamed protein product [Closterium sp. Naga37s-1]